MNGMNDNEAKLTELCRENHENTCFKNRTVNLREWSRWWNVYTHDYVLLQREASGVAVIRESNNQGANLAKQTTAVNMSQDRSKNGKEINRRDWEKQETQECLQRQPFKGKEESKVKKG